jgi:hypothetical protein
MTAIDRSLQYADSTRRVVILLRIGGASAGAAVEHGG